MKFLFVANFVKDENSGAAGHIVLLGRSLREKAHAVDFVFRDDFVQKTKRHAIWHAVIFFLFPVLIIPKVFHLELINHYDFMVISSGDGFLCAALLKIFRRNKRPVVIMRSHGYEYLYKKEFDIEKLFYKEEAFSLRERLFLLQIRLIQVKIFSYLCDAIFPLNANEKIYLERLYPGKKILVMPTFLDPVFLSKTPAARDRDILFVGGWCRMKGWPYLRDIIIRLLEDNKGLKVSLVGTGVDDEYVLKKFPKTVQKNLRAVKTMPRSGIKREYDTHKVFLFPSLFEGFGNVVLEAMACGMTVIISEGLGVSEIIENNRNGFLVVKRDVKEFARITGAALRDKLLMDRVGSSARMTAGHLTLDNVSDMFLKRCEEVHR